MNNTERRYHHGGEVRADDGGMISGYAAVWYREGEPGTEYELWEGARERIRPGAFRAVIDSGADVRALFNHNPDHLLGRLSAGTLRISEDERGLRYEITPGTSSVHTDIREHIRRGDLSGSSFGFRVSGQEWTGTDGDAVREITEVSALIDVGPVTFPAYGAASTGVRSEEEPSEARRAFQEWQQELDQERAEIGRKNAGRLRAARILEIEAGRG